MTELAQEVGEIIIRTLRPGMKDPERIKHFGSVWAKDVGEAIVHEFFVAVPPGYYKITGGVEDVLRIARAIEGDVADDETPSVDCQLAAQRVIRALIGAAAYADSDETPLEEARRWARHGYEIAQRSATWSDHGVAPKWLTEDSKALEGS